MIHFLNLKKLNQPFEAAFQKKMKQFLEGGWYVLGNEVKQFETDFGLENMRVVFKDSSFKDSVVKTNALQILKQNGINEVVSV